MTPLSIRFTGLTLDPMGLLTDRVHYGVIPEEWCRYRFTCENPSSTVINRWLTNNIEGRWAIIISGYNNFNRDVTIAFERNADASMFVLSDGAAQCCQESY